MKVYRIESFKTGDGPFKKFVVKDKHYRIPGPARDGVFGTLEDYSKTDTRRFKYGFQSKKHMLKWFKKNDLKYFKNNKMSVVEYDISPDHIHFGSNQCAFDPEQAYKRKSIPIKRVLN